jgi:hypothetical protein
MTIRQAPGHDGEEEKGLQFRGLVVAGFGCIESSIASFRILRHSVGRVRAALRLRQGFGCRLNFLGAARNAPGSVAPNARAIAPGTAVSGVRHDENDLHASHALTRIHRRRLALIRARLAEMLSAMNGMPRRRGRMRLQASPESSARNPIRSCSTSTSWAPRGWTCCAPSARSCRSRVRGVDVPESQYRGCAEAGAGISSTIHGARARCRRARADVSTAVQEPKMQAALSASAHGPPSPKLVSGTQPPSDAPANGRRAHALHDVQPARPVPSWPRQDGHSCSTTRFHAQAPEARRQLYQPAPSIRSTPCAAVSSSRASCSRTAATR